MITLNIRLLTLILIVFSNISKFSFASSPLSEGPVQHSMGDGPVDRHETETVQQLFPGLSSYSNDLIGAVVQYYANEPDNLYVISFRDPFNWYSLKRRPSTWYGVYSTSTKPIQELYPKLKGYSNYEIGVLAMYYTSERVFPLALDKPFIDWAIPCCPRIFKKAASYRHTAACLNACCDLNAPKGKLS